MTACGAVCGGGAAENGAAALALTHRGAHSLHIKGRSNNVRARWRGLSDHGGRSGRVRSVRRSGKQTGRIRDGPAAHKLECVTIFAVSAPYWRTCVSAGLRSTQFWLRQLQAQHRQLDFDGNPNTESQLCSRHGRGRQRPQLSTNAKRSARHVKNDTTPFEMRGCCLPSSGAATTRV